ncbi:hypothetical protein OQH60_03515 [Campylobacter sp. MIT 21-1685]|uniref:hypothetical protein n=1 Tax=unclassified Campylobacter TaxID=2593542 RepID=UPI00224A8DB2|nr:MULTISPECIES: hypothetical protein [unclassified Campylobacter]MCX2682931.1 hypothetical protein [Campylobacter sp. MIT 21-1684]MCX2751213.1 hypothetical protein [Campylobacter sp. MIT 21-1682]MCX2807412.1 hypothetical protein [Campylobacter sp. MIT 21-1685]
MIIKDVKTLLQEIDRMLGNSKEAKIILLCPNINQDIIESQNNSLLKHIISKNTTIYSFEQLNEAQIFKSPSQQNSKTNNIKSFHSKDANEIINAILDSIKKSAKLSNKKYDSLEDMLSDIEEIEQISLQDCKKIIHNKIKNITESDLFNNVKEDLLEQIDQTLDTLEQYIKESLNDRKKDITKNIITAIVGGCILFLSGGSLPIILTGASIIALSAFINDRDSKNKTYNYMKNPIIDFLTTQLAMCMQFVNTRLLSCMLIVESTKDSQKTLEFIDLSGFNTAMNDPLTMCSQNIAFKGKMTLPNEVKDIEALIEALLEQRDITLPTIDANDFSTQAISIYKADDIKNNNVLLNSIATKTRQFNHIVYLESPHFNSALLAEIFNNKNKQYPNNHTTNMAKNYLIITNAPSKYNAGLTEMITNTILDNTIKDEINNRQIRNPNIFYQNKQKSYNPSRDYSEYKIEITKKDDEPFVLQLSPFARVDSEKIKAALENNNEYKQAKKDYERLCKEYANSIHSNYSPGDLNILRQTRRKKTQINRIEQSYGLEYIDSFFKTPNDIEEIVRNEEQMAKDYLQAIENFTNDIKNKTLLDIFSIFCSVYLFRFYFPYFPYTSEVIKNGSRLKFTCLNETYDFTLHSYNMEIDKIKHIAQALRIHFLPNTNEINNAPHNNQSDSTENFFNEIDKLIYSSPDDFKETLEKSKQQTSQDLQQEIQDLLDLQNDLQGFQEKEQYKQSTQAKHTQEILQVSILKIIGAICPLINFTHENTLDTIKHCITIYLNVLSELNNSASIAKTLLKEIGIFSIAFVPNIRVHIAINNEVATLQQTLRNNMSNIDKLRNHIVSTLNANVTKVEQAIMGYTQFDLRITQAQIRYFHAKSAFILHSHKLQNAKTLDIEKLKAQLIKQENTAFGKKFIKNLHITHTNKNHHSSYKIGINQAKEILKQAQTTHTHNIFYQIKFNLATAGIDIALNLVLNSLMPTSHENRKREFDSIMHKRYKFYYDVPYAIKRKEKVRENIVRITQTEIYNDLIETTRQFTYYPMAVFAKFISFDMQSMIYGTELCTGGLSHHIGLAYLLEQNNNEQIRDFILHKLLSYLIIDEKRGANNIDYIELDTDKQIDDIAFFKGKNLNGNDIAVNINLNNILAYKVPKSTDKNSLYQQFKALEKEGESSAIDAYNEVLDILNDYKDYYFTNTRTLDSKGNTLSIKEDVQKARRLLECLNTIGRNNIKALYRGTSEDSIGMIRPKFIGRLATTIIIENGLWLG